METTPSIHAEMHADHVAWIRELQFWRDELRAWQQELLSAQQGLSKVEQALRQHDSALQQHAAAVRLYEQSVGQHEQAIQQFEHGGASEQLVSMAASHQQEAVTNARLRAVHERLKQRHHAILTHWATLCQAMSDVEG